MTKANLITKVIGRFDIVKCSIEALSTLMIIDKKKFKSYQIIKFIL